MSAMLMHGFFFIRRKEKYVKTRIALWDNLKFVLILLVVIGHFSKFFQNDSSIYRSIFLFIYAFHMPLFLFISGLFHKDEKIGEKCLFYISIGFFQKIIFYLTNLIVGIKSDFVLLGDNGIPWFMFVLAIYTIITYLLRHQNKLYICVFVMILACFVGLDTSIGDYLYLSRSIIFYPCYLLGTIVDRRKIEEIKEKNKVLLVPAILIIALWIYMCIEKIDVFYPLRLLFSGRNPFSGELYYIGPVERMICYIITFFVSVSLVILIPSKRIMWISKMGSRSIDVYFWHWPVYLLLERFFHIKQIFFLGVEGRILFLVIAVVVTVVLSSGGIISYPINLIKNCCYKKQSN